MAKPLRTVAGRKCLAAVRSIWSSTSPPPRRCSSFSQCGLRILYGIIAPPSERVDIGAYPQLCPYFRRLPPRGTPLEGGGRRPHSRALGAEGGFGRTDGLRESCDLLRSARDARVGERGGEGRQGHGQ